MDSIPLWLLFIFFILIGAYFAVVESGFSAVNKIRIKARADDGDRRARSVQYVLNHFEKALTTILVGVNIAHIAAASVATLLATRIIYKGADVPDDKAFLFSVLCTVASTAVVFLFSEMIPKALANDRSETTSLLMAGSMRFFMKIMTPVTAFFGLISKGASKLFAREEAPTITEDELGDIIETAEEEGVVDEEQGDMLKSALEFSDTRVGDVMTMIKDVEMLNAAAATEEILAFLRDTVHSRIPVYAGTPDHVIGTLRTRHYLIEYRRNPKVRLRSLLAAPYFVDPNAKIDDVLDDMRRHKHHMAIVTDENKRAVGLVTIEDFLEELVGEIFDEEDVVDENFRSLGGNRYLVNTHMLVGELFSRIEQPVPRGTAAKPLLTWMLELMGHLPEEDESVLYGENIEITADTVENGTPTMALVHILDENDLAERRAEREEVEP